MKTAILISASAALLLGVSAQAQQYVRGSAGIASQADSDNAGAFTSDFQLGILADTTVPSGSAVGWTTEFEDGTFLSAAYGQALASGLRIEGEISFISNGVDTHSGVTVEGFGNIDTLDAGILLGATQTDALGVTVGALVADGRGSVETLALMVNGYYDIPLGEGPLSAYAGLGAGIGQTSIEFAPSGVGIIDDDATGLVYQIMFGAEYAMNETASLYAGYRFRGGDAIETSVDLFPATLDIDNETNIVEFGVRYSF